MSVVSELIRTEADGTISFGNYELPPNPKNPILSMTAICIK